MGKYIVSYTDGRGTRQVSPIVYKSKDRATKAIKYLQKIKALTNIRMKKVD